MNVSLGGPCPQAIDKLSRLDALAQRLMAMEQLLVARPSSGSKEQAECGRLMDLVHFHQRSLLEWLSPQGEALGRHDPQLFISWEEEAKWFLDRLEVACAT